MFLLLILTKWVLYYKMSRAIFKIRIKNYEKTYFSGFVSNKSQSFLNLWVDTIFWLSSGDKT